MSEKIKEIIRKNPELFFKIYDFLLPLKKIKNKKKYNKQFLISLNELKKSKTKKIFYIGVPTHNNLGDQAQYYCIKKYLKENYKEYDIIEFVDDIIYTNYKNIIKILKENISNEDFFVFQSGYRTTDVSNFEGEYAHEMILNNFKNKVIIFPQTVNFKLKNQENRSIKAYKKNNNYIFLARDEISFNLAKKMYDSEKVFLYPDIVTTLIGNNFIKTAEKRDGILLCLRNDKEKLYSNAEYDLLIEDLKEITSKIDITDTNSNIEFTYSRSRVKEELEKKLKEFSKYKLVITDRYHGTIFSLICNTPVIILNSTDHKLSSGVNWFKNKYDFLVTYCNDLNDALSIAKEKYNKKVKNISDSYFKDNYYDKLKGIFYEE